MRNSTKLLVALNIFLLSCNQESDPNEDEKTVVSQLPDTSYVKDPIEKFDTVENVIQLKHMQEFYGMFRANLVI